MVFPTAKPQDQGACILPEQADFQRSGKRGDEDSSPSFVMLIELSAIQKAGTPQDGVKSFSLIVCAWKGAVRS